jgi:hypothetical protein
VNPSFQKEGRLRGSVLYDRDREPASQSYAVGLVVYLKGQTGIPVRQKPIALDSRLPRDDDRSQSCFGYLSLALQEIDFTLPCRTLNLQRFPLVIERLSLLIDLLATVGPSSYRNNERDDGDTVVMAGVKRTFDSLIASARSSIFPTSSAHA